MDAKELKIIKNRLSELANRAYSNNIYTFTDFLSLADQSSYYESERELSYIVATLWGGNEFCERRMIRFGDNSLLGYDVDFPIDLLHISPAHSKFAEKLTHRDILGAVMNLGLERGLIGDIFVKNDSAYIYCNSSISEYICQNLLTIKHTSIRCIVTNEVIDEVLININCIIVQTQSDRIDGVIAKVYNLSRSQVALLFREKRVFVNGRQMENQSYNLKESDVVSVRGYGKFRFIEVIGQSKKGKNNVKIEKYI